MSVVDDTVEAIPSGIGVSAVRPDGKEKVKGDFIFSSDLSSEGMLWGQTLRSPHSSARILNIDISDALSISGVHAVLTADDVPGENIFGLERADQPVLANDFIRYAGEPVAIVAADHPEIARKATDAIKVEYEILSPLVDSSAAITAKAIHPEGNVIRHLNIVHGDTEAVGDVIVEGEYEVGLQDRAFMGTASGMAIPSPDGGIDLQISTQWLHSDQEQVATALNMPIEMVRVTLAGVGGAFGGREDVSMHVHLCMLALYTGKPVKMIYDRNESFLGHVHRHPARIWYRHHASFGGRLVKVEAKVILDGGAYASTTSAVLANACCFSIGPYSVPNASVEGWGVRTNNPPCGAMRGFGNVQTCFAVEAQMDKLAKELNLDPVEFRLNNALKSGDTIITGQEITGTAPVREVLMSLANHPLPGPSSNNLLELPGGTGRTTDGSHVKRGVGFAASIKNLMFSEGFDDFSEARCIVDDGFIAIQTACVEVGQGLLLLSNKSFRKFLELKRLRFFLLIPQSVQLGRHQLAVKVGCLVVLL